MHGPSALANIKPRIVGDKEHVTCVDPLHMKPGPEDRTPMANLDDILLGFFGSAIPPSPQLEHAVRFCGTWSGSDKLMMTVQYAVKLLAPLLQLRAELQYRAHRRVKPVSAMNSGLIKFASQLSVARRVSGFWGIIAILKGLSSLERAKPASRLQLNLQRLQGISMILFYPLDYIAFFSSPMAPLLRCVSPAASMKVQLWSIRAWGVYVALQVMLLRNEWKELARTQLTLDNAREDKTDCDEVSSVRKRRQAIVYQMVANVSRLPVILHWSVKGGIYNSEVLTNVLSFVSAIAAFLGGWESTRVPPPKR